MQIKSPLYALNKQSLVLVSRRHSSGGFDKKGFGDGLKKNYLKMSGSSIRTATFYKWVFVGAIPFIGFSLFMAHELEHKYDHEEMPKFKEEYKEYPYLNLRKKKFAWGDGNKVLFHSENNFVPGKGFEESEGHH